MILKCNFEDHPLFYFRTELMFVLYHLNNFIQPLDFFQLCTSLLPSPIWSVKKNLLNYLAGV
ncbi:MAG TPA: hypothetical protein DDW50_07980 [Firmicutes bacterium]|nr:hypothetical protein [Bacillota bacterium]